MKKFNEEYLNDIALADTLSNSVNLNDIDMAIDKNVKYSKIVTEKEFKNVVTFNFPRHGCDFTKRRCY